MFALVDQLNLLFYHHRGHLSLYQLLELLQQHIAVNLQCLFGWRVCLTSYVMDGHTDSVLLVCGLFACDFVGCSLNKLQKKLKSFIDVHLVILL